MRARCSRAMAISRWVQVRAVSRVAPDRMRGGVARNALAHALDEPIFVLAVEGGAAAGLAQDVRHARVVGDQQRAGGRAHEDFYARRARQALEFRNIFGVFMRAADPEGEIAMHSPGSPRNLVGESLRRGGQRDWCWAFRTRRSRRRARRRASRFRDLPYGSGRARGNAPGCRSRRAEYAARAQSTTIPALACDKSPMAAMVSPMTPMSRGPVPS